MTKPIKNDHGVMKLTLFGASLAGLAASYFFLGPNGKKHEKESREWAIKMKNDVLEKLRQTRDISQSAYKEIIDSITLEYERAKKVNRDELRALAQDLKKHWKIINKSGKNIKKNVLKSAKKAVRKKQTTIKS